MENAEFGLAAGEEAARNHEEKECSEMVEKFGAHGENEMFPAIAENGRWRWRCTMHAIKPFATTDACIPFKRCSPPLTKLSADSLSCR